MKYYLVVGEASGVLHASKLMEALLREDDRAEFRFFGGDGMRKVGGVLVKHYREMAFMGFVPVLLHLRTIFRNMRQCKQDILAWNPDVVILVDYPGFNLAIAKYIRTHSDIPVFYYISPKIWAWKEYRIKDIKRYVNEMFSILPFEVPFYNKHQYPIHYIGNPSVEEVFNYKSAHQESFEDFVCSNQLSGRPVIALLAGSRRQEIKDNLPDMICAAQKFSENEIVLAGAPGIDAQYYDQYIEGKNVKIVYGQTYRVLSHASAALVTSGTATLEAALFRVPQVVCYHTPLVKLISFLRRHLLKVKYISLVNLIVGRELVRELVAETMTVNNMQEELDRLLNNRVYRSQTLAGYDEMMERLGETNASENAAREMMKCLMQR